MNNVTNKYTAAATKMNKYDKNRRKCRDAFTFLEVLIVAAIIAVLAVIAIPRICRSSRCADTSALAADLAVLRNAIEVFSAEHAGTYPSVSNIVNQLTQYTDAFGDAQPAKDNTHIYGPYLQRIPPLPVGSRKGCTGIAAEDASDVGWIYDENTGWIRANTITEKALSGMLYRDF